MADEDLEAILARIPSGAANTTPNLQCCCGRTECSFLKHNCSALDDLEQEVRTAASLGQALLVRHEQYMVEAERERFEMSAKIERLESDKKQLAAENAKNVEENRDLLDQLEGLNTTVSQTESHIKSLETTLQSTHQELRRLEGLASRTHELEIQLATLEHEQAILQRTVVTTEAQEKSALQRWRRAERGLLDLQDQLEKIEREAREERERHVEIIGRMERQRAVERELDTAAGRLKAVAATSGNGKHGSQVVSHFVKDILQDNANLQLGIVELREMLMNSNDEVQALREQLMLHGPAMEQGEEDGEGQATLKAEIAPQETAKHEGEPRVVNQELHIHHHYHPPAKKEIVRPRKKRTSLNSIIFTPSQPNSPRLPRSRDTSGTILSQTSVTIPSPSTPTNRWSLQSGPMSEFAASSVPSSPTSNYRNSGLFDRGFDSSRPTSPGSSVDPCSPAFQPYHRKRGSDISTRSFIQPMNFQPNHTIHEEDDDVEELPDLGTASAPSLEDDFGQSSASDQEDRQRQDYWSPAPFQPRLRRSTSHESIISISGIDIHTLKLRPSQITLTGNSALLRPRNRLGMASPAPSMISVDTITGSSMITARPTLSRQGHDSTYYLRSTIGDTGDNHSIRSSNSSNDGLGKKVGGWVWGKWGVTPTKSANDLRTTPKPAVPNRSVSSSATDAPKVFMGRPPGINQKGPIPGFRKSEKAPSAVKPTKVDHDALRETLLEADNVAS
ncbi:hypothetical protein BP6252_03104 [Coleophoma cylindrospora]|uniref:Uncharacterized protein n=1 Tax=Coleophoma cylindrospora TaxID=1849047 RepID=A0A3D8S6S6_9HELO|nr:hypothetical protein BP6252_03104 [Coleophoma cylindrospora]